MAEPPSGWTTPGDPVPEPGQQPPGWGAPPVQQPGQHPPAWGAPPTQQPGQQPPGWGMPPQQQPPPGNWSSGGWSNRGPGIVPLRPLTVGEIYDGTIRAIRSNPRTMVGFSAIVIAVLTLLATGPQALFLNAYLNSPLLQPQAGQTLELSDLTDLAGAGALAAVVGVLQFMVATTVVSGLLIVAVNSAVRGQILHPGELWVRCRGRLLALLGLACLVLLAVLLVWLVALAPGLIVVFLPGGKVFGAILLVLGTLLAAACSLALYFGFWAVSAPALLLEKLGPFAALRRSYRLVRGSFWRVFGIGLLTALIAYIVRQIFTVPFSLIGGVFTGFQGGKGFSGALIQLLITDIGTILAGAVVYPFTAGVAALLYLDLRMRQEGLDVDLMRQ
jgi:hypothetical protein